MLKIIGHRGARGLAPENTLAAIEASLKAGADMLEVDVRVTKDGVPILHHDPTLQELPISQRTLRELRTRKADVATLQDAIDLVNRRVPMILEVKPHVTIKTVVELVQKYLEKGWKKNDFFISCFDFKLLTELHAALPELPTAVLERWSGIRATRRAKRLGTPYICMKQHFLWWGFIASMQKKYKLSAYTLNDPAKAKRWAKHGLYGVVTDYPDRFRKQK